MKPDHQSFQSNRNRAFTLLEILLVVAIIAILAGIVIVAINPAKQLGNARDSQRKSDINTIYKAVNQYLIDEGHFPTTITSILTAICDPTQTCSGIDLDTYLVSDYLGAIPKDPQATTDAGYKIARVGTNVYVEAPLTEVGFTNQAGYSSTTQVAAFIGSLPDGHYPGVATNGGGIVVEDDDGGDGEEESTLGDGLVAHYTMNDNLATTDVVDTKGNTGTATDSTENLHDTGVIDGAFNFGVSDYVTTSLVPFTGDDNASFAAWIKTSSESTAAGIFGTLEQSYRVQYGVQGLVIFENHKARAFFGTGEPAGDHADVMGTSDINDGEWHHIVATHTSSTNIIYVDGVKENEEDAGPFDGGSDVFKIGMVLDAWHFDGFVDDVRIYNRVLSQTEVSELYNTGSGTEGE